MPKLILQCKGQEWTVDLKQGGNVVGRSSSCAVPVRDSNLSREHCDVVLSGDVARVLDKGSTNGTLVNGSRVSEHVLKPGDRISIGQTVVWYEAKGRISERKSPGDDSAESANSGVDTKRSLQPAEPRPETRRTAGTLLKDYSLWGRPSGSWIKGAVVLAVLGLVAAAVLAVRSLGGSAVAVQDPDNLVSRNPSFELWDNGKPVAWTLRGKSSNAISADPTQGRNGGACLVLEKKGDSGDIVVECACAEEFALGRNGTVNASAFARFDNFIGWAAVKIEWLRAVNRETVAEEISAPVSKAPAWTSLAGTFTAPPGAGAFRLALVAAGRSGRVYFDDVSAQAKPGAGGADGGRKVGPHRVAATRAGVLQIDLRGRRSLVDFFARLDNDKEGSMPQFAAQEVSEGAEKEKLALRGKMASPVDQREIEFEERVQHEQGETTVVYAFRGASLRQVDRVTLLFTLSRVDQVEGIPATPEQTTRRLSFTSDEGEVAIEYPESIHVRADRVRGGLRVAQSFPVDSNASDLLIALKIVESQGGSDGADPLQAASRLAREERPGDAMVLLRKSLATFKEPLKRDEAEREIRQLESDERKEWTGVQAKAFQGWMSRRTDLAGEAFREIDGYRRRWPGAEFRAKADELRGKIEEMMRTEVAEMETARPRRVLERARQCAEAGRKALAQAMLESLLARNPPGDIGSEARQLLNKVSQ